MGVVWAWLVGVTSVLELVFKKLEPMTLYKMPKLENPNYGITVE